MILYSPLDVKGTLRMHPQKCGSSREGGEEGGEVGGPAQPISGARGLWVGLQALVKHMRYMCIRTYMGGRSWVVIGSGSAWARLLGCRLNGALGGMVLTCGYVWGPGNVRLGVWGQRGRQRGGEGSPRSCGADRCCG